MEFNNLIFEVDGKIGLVTLNRPEKRNALSLGLMNEFNVLLKTLRNRRDIQVLIIRGEGPAFCAGHDMGEMVGKEKDINHFRRIFTVCSEMMLMLHDIPQVVIAQVQGIATAAGCQLVAACDLAVASEDARFATPGVKIGLFCTTPMVPLVRVIGRRRALYMLFTGRFISATEAQEFGLVNTVVPLEKLGKETRKLAEEISLHSALTLAIGKEAFYNQMDMEERQSYGYAKEVIASNCITHDAQEGMGAFLSKRVPEWRNK